MSGVEGGVWFAAALGVLVLAVVLVAWLAERSYHRRP